MLAVLERDIVMGSQITRIGILKNERKEWKELQSMKSKAMKEREANENQMLRGKCLYLRLSRPSLLPDPSRQYGAFREFVGASPSDRRQVTTREIASPQKLALWIIVEISLGYRGISHSISSVCFIAPCDYCF